MEIMMPKFKYRLSGLLLGNIFVEILVILFFKSHVQTQMATLVNFWGHPVYVSTVTSGDQVNFLMTILIIFFLAQILLGLVSAGFDKKPGEFVFQLPPILTMLNKKVGRFSLLDGVVIWLIVQSWVFIFLGFALANLASIVAVFANVAVLLFIAVAVVKNIGTRDSELLVHKK
ncbi:hypothetical protein ACLJJ6_01245 [Pediococcus siamensis]|uniref:hypothetical protein n=1 Tax=Pediococcus siamensis TaxID=381829 RepID=UPI0039A33BDF